MRTDRTRGFTLVEIMATFPIFLLASALAVELIGDTVKLGAANAQAAMTNSRLDSSLFRLRRDVWGCSTIIADDKTATATFAEKKITWHIADDGSLTRDDGAAQQTWSDIAAHWRFATAPFGLIITTSTPRGDQQMPLVNQIMVAGRTAP
jgi:type II secretory pathway pseudopilin PulG